MPSRPLSSSPALWRLPFGHFSEADMPNQALRRKVLARDANRCADCDLVLSRHMEVRHLDDDHENMAEANLACVCPFCHMRDHLGPTGFAGAGIIIGHSLLSQAHVNVLTLSIWYIQARIENKVDIRQMPDAGEAESEEAWRRRLREQADSLWGELTEKCIRFSGAYSPLATEPDALGGVLNELARTAPEAYANRDKLLAGLHILPVREAFNPQCRDWFAEFDRTRPVTSWVKGFDTFMARIGVAPEAFYEEVTKTLRAATRTPSGPALLKPMGEGQPAAGIDPGAAPETPGRPGIGKRYAD